MADQTLYVSKNGLDTNDGLTPQTSKLTLNGAKAILSSTGETNLYIGIGTYTENIAFNSTSNNVNLIGDYNGVIFGSAAGTVQWQISSNQSNTGIKSMNRMTFRHTGGFGVFHSVYKSTIYNYVIFNFGNSGQSLMGFGGLLTITHNNCTYSFNSSSSKILNSDNYSNRNKIIMNDCTTSGSSFISLNNFGGSLEMNNTTLNCLSGFLGFMTSGMAFITNGSNIKFSDTDNYNELYEPNGYSYTEYISSAKYTYIKDSNFTKSTGVLKESNNFCLYANKSDITVSQLYNVNRHKIILDNLNSSGVIDLLSPSTKIRKNNDTYNSKQIINVVYFNGDRSGITKNGCTVFKLNNVDVSSAYSLAFDYYKNLNVTTNNASIYFAILKDSQSVYNDLYTNPGNALAYGFYSANDHSYQTWYAKTLSFTTTSDANNSYYLVMTPYNDIGYNVNFKITIPTLTKQ